MRNLQGMRSATLKRIILLGTLVIILIITLQLYWLKRVYALEEHQFSTAVVKSIRGLFEDVEMAEENGEDVKKKVERVDNSTFVIRTDLVPQKDSIQYYLGHEFEDFDVWTDCLVGVYSHRDKAFAYQFYLQTAASPYPGTASTSLKPVMRDHDYLFLFFPHRSNYILNEMKFWILGAVALLLVLVGLMVSLIYLYRQRFLNELQTDFVNNFTHEFKTPLAVMKIASEVMVQPDIITRPDRLKKYSNVIAEQTAHLQSQVERLLSTAKSENSELSIQSEPCNLNEEVAGAIEKLEPLIQAREAIVQLVRDENEPVILADKAHLQLVIINLVENALKYSIRKPEIVIQVQAAENNHYAISIRDNGIGIDEKYYKKIYHKFFRVPTGNVHHVNGFGLGLNFVKKVVDAHEGKIVVHSVPGIGTEFRILLPKK